MRYAILRVPSHSTHGSTLSRNMSLRVGMSSSLNSGFTTFSGMGITVYMMGSYGVCRTWSILTTHPILRNFVYQTDASLSLLGSYDPADRATVDQDPGQRFLATFDPAVGSRSIACIGCSL